MSSFRATLEMGGKEYDVLYSNYEFKRNTDAKEKRRAVGPFVGKQALAEPFGTVLEALDVPLAHGVEVQRKLEAVVVVDRLVKPERLEGVKTLAVDADGDVVV